MKKNHNFFTVIYQVVFFLNNGCILKKNCIQDSDVITKEEEFTILHVLALHGSNAEKIKKLSAECRKKLSSQVNHYYCRFLHYQLMNYIKKK